MVLLLILHNDLSLELSRAHIGVLLPVIELRLELLLLLVVLLFCAFEGFLGHPTTVLKDLSIHLFTKVDVLLVLHQHLLVRRLASVNLLSYVEHFCLVLNALVCFFFFTLQLEYPGLQLSFLLGCVVQVRVNFVHVVFVLI